MGKKAVIRKEKVEKKAREKQGMSKKTGQKKENEAGKEKAALPESEKTALTAPEKESKDGLKDYFGVRVRRNGLQLKKTLEEEEKELLKEEKMWEMPAFLRRKKKNDI